MEYLPILAVDEIIKRLNASDLLSCALVSVTWRQLMNNDNIWKTLCHRHCHSETIDCVQTMKSCVEPVFKPPKTYHQRLQPLCYWRVMYMKLQHVKRNWCLANHKVHNITELAYNHFELKIDRNIMIANVNDNLCEVWDILYAPQKQETITCGLKITRCKCMIHVSGDNLVIVQDTLLQVYNRTEKTFKLSFRRIFNEIEANSQDIPDSLHIDDWYDDKVKLRPTHLQAFNMGKHFIGLAENGSFDDTSFHIWDTVVGGKIKEQSVKAMCHGNRDHVYNIKFCLPKTDLGKILVCIQHSDSSNTTEDASYYTVIYEYNLISLVFKRLNVIRPHVPWIYFEDNIIITIGDNLSKMSLYASTSGSQVISKKYDDIINPDSVQVQGDYLGFTTGGNLVILNIIDFKLVFTTFITKFSSNVFGFDFLFLDWDLILISHWDTTVNNIEVWSTEKKCPISTLKTRGLMFPCNNSAKFFVWNEMASSIYMLQFW